MMEKSKQLFTTSTFWLNVTLVAVSAGLQYIGGLDIDPTVQIAIAALANLVKRLGTKNAAHL